METSVEVLEGRLEESNSQLKAALRKLEDSHGKMTKLDLEATSLREELSDKIDERNEAEFQLEALRQKHKIIKCVKLFCFIFVEKT